MLIDFLGRFHGSIAACSSNCPSPSLHGLIVAIEQVGASMVKYGNIITNIYIIICVRIQFYVIHSNYE